MKNTVHGVCQRQAEQHRQNMLKDDHKPLFNNDTNRIDWIEKMMKNDDNYCEIFLAGLRNFTGQASAFQVESQPEKFKTVNAPTLREAIDKAMLST